MTVGELLIKLGYETDKASEEKVQSQADALKGTLKKMLGAVGIAFTVTGIKNFIQETSSAYADFKATATQFDNTFEGMQETAKASLKSVSEATGIAETRMKGSYSRMAAFAMTTGMEMSQANDFTSRAMVALADNAAYFDKSIEETQDTFQKLLKGNFQLDDNLGFNLAESERNKMAQEMFGESSFSNLEDWQKQELILQKLIQANEDMGAGGQAAKEAGEFTNQVGELSDALLQLKVSIGAIFLQPMLNVMTRLKDIAFEVADAFGDVEDHTSLAYRAQQTAIRVVDKLINVFDKTWNLAKNIVKAFGGVNNVLGVLGTAIGVILAYKVVGRILTAKEAVAKFAGSLAKVNWNAVATVAAILMLALVVEDLIGFVQGKDSLFGRMLDYAGIDPEPVRKAFLTIVEVVQTVFQTVRNVFSRIGEAIGASGIEVDIQGIVTAVMAAVATFGAVMGVIRIVMMVTAAVKIAAGVFAGLSSIAGIMGAAIAFLATPAGMFLVAVTALTAACVWLCNNWDLVKEKAQELWDKFLVVGQGIAEGMTAGLNSIIDAGQDVISFFTDLASSALTWGSDMVDNFISGIGNFGGKIAEKVGGGIQWLKDNMGHSKPKEGPLKDDDKWMPDMMDNFVSGIEQGKSRIRSAIKSVAGVLADSKDGLMTLGANLNVTGQNAASESVSRSIIINQNISFANTFNGDTRDNQVRAAGQMKKNATDTTSYLANAIAFGR